MESDLGNVGVQRPVKSYESVTVGVRTTWFSVLACGHEVKLDGEPPGGAGPVPPGRYRDCPACTTLERAEGA